MQEKDINVIIWHMEEEKLIPDLLLDEILRSQKHPGFTSGGPRKTSLTILEARAKFRHCNAIK